MNFNDAKQASRAGKNVARQSEIDEAGDTVETFENYLSPSDFMGASFTLEDFEATDWVVQPERGLPRSFAFRAC